ncbi:MAG TPA: hypothetical protein ENH49_01125 [Candidatus Marinimicrobia bacterium]|nr:hypothetical protein [Candidatus Neomarinimicrobiota bacterium]
MELLKQHEQFEMHVLSDLQSARLLEKLIFGGDTMLRLCHELNRYSVDLDFYLKKRQDEKIITERLENVFDPSYQIRDFQKKRNTILLEISTMQFPRKLKLEINTNYQYSEVEQSIAWSQYSNIQVMVSTISLPKMMELKINALLDRKEIRDAFDLEFMIRRGIQFDYPIETIHELRKVIAAFKQNDYKVKLGSIISTEDRRYYNENKFKFLIQHLNYIESKK